MRSVYLLVIWLGAGFVGREKNIICLHTFHAAILTFLIHDIMVVLLHHPSYISTQIHLCSHAFTAFSKILINLYIHVVFGYFHSIINPRRKE